MRQNPFGKNGPPVSVIGQGTWYLDRGDRKRAIAALQRGIEAGMTQIDTAENVWRCRARHFRCHRGQTDGVFLVSKVLPSNASRRGTIDRLRAFAEAAEDRSPRLLLLHGAVPIRWKIRRRLRGN
jgi:diketogulonate reductase-like aldo/keto reductase